MANMTDLYFLDRVIRAYPKEIYGEIKIWEDGENTILQIASTQYCYGSLKECIESAKDSFASSWISYIHEENHKA